MGLNAFPFSREGNIRPTLEHCAWLLDQGWSILIYPEGTRSASGTLAPFKAGAGLLAVELGVPVVPVHLAGSAEILPKGRTLPRRGRVQVHFGQPLRFGPRTAYADATAAMEDAVRSLSATVTSAESEA
jgi:long-chain acyl-CoA synthetase